MGRLHPAEGDLVDLEKYISGMPGGSYIGEQWKGEPKVVVAVYISDIVYQNDTFNAIKKAYPPRLYGEDGASWAAEYLFHVPRTVAEILDSAPIVTNERETSWQVRPLAAESAEELGEITEDTLDALMSLWVPRAISEFFLEHAAERLVSIRRLAAELDQTFGAVLETVNAIWEEISVLDFERALNTAAGVLA